MTIGTYALLDASGSVLNVIEWDGVSILALPAGVSSQATPATDGSAAAVGGTFNGTSFIAPAPITPPFNNQYTSLTVTTNADFAKITQGTSLVRVNKTTGSPSTIPMAYMTPMQIYSIADVKGDAATNPHTITTPLCGDGKINGQNSYVNTVSGSTICLQFDGNTTTTV